MAQRAMAMSYAFEANCKKTVEYEQQVFDYYRTVRDFFQQGEIANEAARVCIESGDLDTLQGYVAFYSGDYKTALDELLKANQDDPFIECMIGQTYEKLGNKDKAIEFCGKASGAISHNPAAAYAVPFSKKRLASLS
jgi:tetratricopeptide (TPR) repeat protein